MCIWSLHSLRSKFFYVNGEMIVRGKGRREGGREGGEGGRQEGWMEGGREGWREEGRGRRDGEGKVMYTDDRKNGKCHTSIFSVFHRSSMFLFWCFNHWGKLDLLVALTLASQLTHLTLPCLSPSLV